MPRKKRGPGRPPIKKQVNFRLSLATCRALKHIARERKLTMTETVELLITHEL